MSDGGDYQRCAGDQREANSELEQKLLWALRRARKLGLPEEDVRLLCYGCGIQYKYVTSKSTQEK